MTLQSLSQTALGIIITFASRIIDNYRYLLEAGSWQTCRDTIALGMESCEDKNGIWYAHLCNSAGVTANDTCHTADARRYLTESLRIRSQIFPPEHIELCHIYHNLGQLINTEAISPEHLKESIAYFEKALGYDMKLPASETRMVLPLRYHGLSAAYIFSDRWEEAEVHIEKSRQLAIEAFGPDAYPVAT
jgi:hypothetical protein